MCTDEQLDQLAEAIVSALTPRKGANGRYLRDEFETPDMLIARIKMLGQDADNAGKPLTIGELTERIANRMGKAP